MRKDITVEIGYKRFHFEDLTKAVSFADMAFEANKRDSDDVTLVVRYEDDEEVEADEV